MGSSSSTTSSVQATVPPSSRHQTRSAAAAAAAATGSAARTEVNIAVHQGRDNSLALCLPRAYRCLDSVVANEFRVIGLRVEFLDCRREKRAVLAFAMFSNGLHVNRSALWQLFVPITCVTSVT